MRGIYNRRICIYRLRSNGAFSIPDTDWEKLLTAAKGKQVEVSVLTEEKGKWNAFLPFHIRVSEDPIDPYIAYRLIDPGYQLWNEMGIYQRELSSFDQEPILENRLTDNNCMNCHSFCMQDPDKMLFHVRAKYGCTVFVDGDRIETLDTKTIGRYRHWSTLHGILRESLLLFPSIIQPRIRIRYIVQKYMTRHRM